MSERREVTADEVRIAYVQARASDHMERVDPSSQRCRLAVVEFNAWLRKERGDAWEAGYEASQMQSWRGNPYRVDQPDE